ncbi:hypothetical protein FXO38_30369 [Capsicum annuum]|uniref:Uncharacterized protein n=1 Tax=Capsicum annuum TaxID=4072 RepID=A0A2G2Y6Q4_CAPAN|nr:hypothetical protein FXO38_30369 [Capsicum annuum]KAF3679877.1 hypothetical protein FXO37_03618 [Capsicum annuum]PHT65251.1 hypothetical protein T459_29676 [Capsicum annuum]
MKNSNEKKSQVINQYIDAKVNVGNKGFLDASKVRPRVALEKEAVVASEMLLRNRASTSLASHGFISSIQPCALASTKPLPTSSAAPFTNCRKHGFASYLARKESELSEYYTRVEIRYPRYEVIHKYTESDFDAKPTVMLLGQYSTGKITFIKHLLKCNYPDDSTVGNFPLKELKKLSPMPTKEVIGCIRNVSLIDDASYVWRICQIRFINKEVLSKMESISEDTTIADRKQIPFNKFLPTLRSGVWSDIGGCCDMEDTQICIADMAKNFGHSIRGEESISFYGVFDGHGGKGAALFVRDCLPRIIVHMC